MKIVKSWKKNLKRTGALALASLVMMGTAGAVDNITLNENGTSDSGSNGNVKTVLGYQTDASTGYAANITWGDMIFVYDNGTYDPENGGLVATPGLSYVQPVIYIYVDENGNEYTKQVTWMEYFDNAEVGNPVEVDEVYLSEERITTFFYEGQYVDVYSYDPAGDAGHKVIKVISYVSDTTTDVKYDLTGLTPKNAAGNWYYFDGTNNAVTVQNLSTSDIKFAASTAVDDTVAGENVSFLLYSANANINLAEDTEKACKPEHGDSETTWYVGSAASGSLTAPVLNDVTGEVTTPGETVEFYLNISGKPSDQIVKESELDDDVYGSALGTITLNFTTEGDSPDSLTPIIPGHVNEDGDYYGA